MLIPGFSILSHWFDNEQRGHLFGYWFGHDMFTPPFMASNGHLSYDAKERAELMKDAAKGKLIYPEMARDAVVFGGTDPGRFAPTYMIFCESFIPARCKPNDPVFDRRDAYLITQNALADGTYLNYIRAHYMRSAENDPPFFQNFFGLRVSGILIYPVVLSGLFTIAMLGLLWGRIPMQVLLGIIAAVDIGMLALWKPGMEFLDKTFTRLGDNIEKSRRAGSSYFKPDDFVDLSGFASRLKAQADPVSKFVFQNLSKETQDRLGNANKDLAGSLARDLNHLLEREFVANLTIAEKTQEQSELELRGSRSGKVDELKKEIAELQTTEPLYTPERFKGVTLSDHVQRFVQENPKSHTRIRLNRLLLEEAYPKQLANSPGGVFPDLEIHTPSPEESQQCFQEYLNDAQRRLQLNQLKPGEDVHIDGGRVQVSGQVAVMSINGLLTKVIFDKTPKHEFYVEESFPLDWMYPYQEPYGIIMKINREPLKEMTQEICDRDHKFWSDYSERFIGNWITYDTPVSELCKFGEKMYLRHDFRGFKGDPKFVRDDNAQKAFSKLRSSIGGVYMWRFDTVQNPVEKQRMFKEAEFAFKQAFAFCPYSPEAVYRYVQLLNKVGRIAEATEIVRTCLKLDPENGQIQNLLTQLESILKQMGAPRQVDSQTIFQEVSRRMEAHQTNEALNLLDQIINSPMADPGTILEAAKRFVALGDTGRLEKTLERLVRLAPDNPEAWYDLAGLQSMMGKAGPALDSLTKAISLSNERIKRDPKARDLVNEARQDPRMTPLRGLPAFKALVPDK
jgi:tetratricopeptide (TPR) repeat protein